MAIEKDDRKILDEKCEIENLARQILKKNCILITIDVIISPSSRKLN